MKKNMIVIIGDDAKAYASQFEAVAKEYGLQVKLASGQGDLQKADLEHAAFFLISDKLHRSSKGSSLGALEKAFDARQHGGIALASEIRRGLADDIDPSIRSVPIMLLTDIETTLGNKDVLVAGKNLKTADIESARKAIANFLENNRISVPTDETQWLNLLRQENGVPNAPKGKGSLHHARRDAERYTKGRGD